MMILVLAMSLMLVACSGEPRSDIEVLEPTSDLAATINGDEVFLDEVLAVQAQLAQQGVDADTGLALNQIFVRLVLMQEANRRGYVFSDEDVEANFEAQGISIEDIRSSIELQGMSYDDFLAEQKDFLSLQLLIDDVAKDIVVSDEEARAFFDSQPELFIEGSSFEDNQDNIKGFIAEQTASNLLIDLSQELIAQANIEVFI